MLSANAVEMGRSSLPRPLGTWAGVTTYTLRPHPGCRFGAQRDIRVGNQSTMSTRAPRRDRPPNHNRLVRVTETAAHHEFAAAQYPNIRVPDESSCPR